MFKMRTLRNLDGALRDCWCCPGHDKWPSDVYRNRRSVRARSRDIKREHRYARHLLKADLRRHVEEEQAD